MTASQTKTMAGVVLALTAFAIAPAAALDWGGSLQTVNTVQTVSDISDDDTFVNAETLSFFLNHTFSPSFRFVSQASVRYDSDDPFVAADLDRLFLQRTRTFDEGSTFRMVTRYGRFTLSEPTELVVSHPVDGAAAIVSGTRAEYTLAGGFTGLVNKEFSPILLTLNDSADDEDDDVVLGPSRFIGTVQAAFANIVGAQSLFFSATFQEDLRDPDAVVRPFTEEGDVVDAGDIPGGLLDSQYWSAVVRGPITGQLYYDATYVLNTGRTLSLVAAPDTAEDDFQYEYRPIVAHAFRLGARYFRPDFLSSIWGATILYSSGDNDYAGFIEGNTDDRATQFTAITPASRGRVLGLQTGNATIAEVYFLTRPLRGSRVELLDTLQVGANAFAFFRSSDNTSIGVNDDVSGEGLGTVSAAGVDPESDGRYLGSEIDVTIRSRPFSDLGVGLTLGTFVANGAVFEDEANDVDFLVRLNASLSF